MASLFATDFADAALGLLFEQFGEAITIAAPGAAGATSYTAIVGDEEAKETTTREDRRQLIQRTVTIAADPASPFGGIADPILHSVVTIGGVDYVLREVLARDGVAVVLRVERTEASDLRGQRYARR